MKKEIALACTLAACVGARVACAGLLYETSCYAAQDNLRIHYDGIRNAGALKAHDSSAAEWVCLGHAACNATFIAKEGDASAWTADGYHFAGGAYAKLNSAQSFGDAVTVQIVADVTRSDNTTTWPSIFGTWSDRLNIYFSGSGNLLHFKADTSTGLNADTRARLANWEGKYLNAALNANEFKQILVQTASFQTGWVLGSKTEKTSVGTQQWSLGGCGANGNFDQSNLNSRYLTGTIKAIRVYNKILSDEELAANRAIDEARFFTGIPVTNVVVATAVSGIEGNESSGVYAYDADGYTFTAPKKVTKDGIAYVCVGYTLETWNGTAWRGAVSCASRSYTATDISAKVRLTWQWRATSGAGSVDLDPLFDSYVTDGLILHVDGIRNVGADKPHDNSAMTWTDLAGGKVASLYHDAGDASMWREDGYFFGGKSYAEFVTRLTGLTNTVTVQVVCDVLPASLKGTTLWPNLVSGNDNDACGVYYDLNGGRTSLTFKNATGGNCGIGNGVWSGRYATAIRAGATNFIMQGTSISGAAKVATDKGDIGTITVRIGSAGSGLGTRSDRWFTGLIKSVRIYDRVLTDEELAANRAIDETRFFGAPLPVTNVVVASSVRGLSGDAPEGAYALAAGGHTFTAPATMTAGDDTYSCTGYTLETWDDATGTWGAPVQYSGVLAAALTDLTAKVRLTWQWTHTAGPGFDAAFNDYATDGLVLQLDGIRNAGTAPVHDDAAATWPDLSELGGYARFVHNAADGSAWTADGYYFGGTSYAVMTSTRTLDTIFTFQVVSEVDTNANCRTAMIWPALLGTTDTGDPMPMYINNNNNNSSAVNCKVGNSNIGITISNWLGEYATAWSDGVNASVFATVTPASTKPFAHSAGTRTITVGSGNGGGSGYASRYLLGTVKSVRIYNRALTNEELARSRAADEARFFARAPTAATGEVIVRSSAEGLSGNQLNGAYRPASSYTFTAPAEVILDGTSYELTGYTLEAWNAQSGTWNAPVSYEGTSCSPPFSTASQRLTWQWKVKSRLTRIRDDYDVGDYVQDGLYLHLDGIRNAGAAADHDGAAETWKNLGTGGANLDAVFDYASNASAGDGWTANGYEFVYGGKFARLATTPSFGNSVTIQTVSLFDTGTSGNPSLFGSSNDFCNVYTVTAGGDAYFKLFNETRVSVRPAGSWEGKYITAIWHRGKYVAFQYEAPLPSDWAGTWYKNLNEFNGEPFYVGGIFKDEGNPGYANGRRFTGTIHAVRVYKRVLTDAELAQNRLVDEARFFGNLPESNVVVVDAGGEQAESGIYKVEGTWTFTAMTARGDNNEIKPVKGYTLETWDGSAWIRAASGQGDSYTYTVGTSPAKVRLTWNALPSGTALIVR